ncbi:MAG TPA: 3-oxoacyl-[acyl-carrier-protein] synthase III C-terminal domain-containing protein [Candidatus Binatia bacterium]|nr:3-oxoacyl-[acyl-carrier-protein] synthase III C-terminal domain-containing protein [Candidatus Binatia bacterium]
MRIAAIAHAVPSRRMTNAEVVALVREQSRSRIGSEGADRVGDLVARFLDAAGTDVRYRLADDEKAIDVVLRASRDALAEAGVAPGDVDLVLYTGVARGWMEPAMATVIQAELGLERATSFDVLDACAGWLRALHVAHSHLRSGDYRVALVVNCECGLYRDYVDFAFDGVTGVEHRLASFTVGEAATGTVITADAPDDALFVFRTFPQHYRLCMLPLRAQPHFEAAEPDARYVPERLFALSRPLLTAGTRRLIELWEEASHLRVRTHDIVFGHNPSEPACALVARRLGVQDRYFPTHKAYGNTVSAALPLGMSVARAAGRLHRGDRVLLAVGSAGITVGFSSLTF